MEGGNEGENELKKKLQHLQREKRNRSVLAESAQAS